MTSHIVTTISIIQLYNGVICVRAVNMVIAYSLTHNSSITAYSLMPNNNKLFFLLQLGGTIGDIEGMPFVEAFRQFQFRVKQDDFCNIHVSLVPQVKLSLNKSSGILLCNIIFLQ